MTWDQRPDRRTRRTYLHLQYMCAQPFGPVTLRDTRPIAEVGPSREASTAYVRCWLFVRQIVRVLEDRETRCQPRRRWWLARGVGVHIAELGLEQRPFDQPAEPHHLVLHVDHLIEPRSEQIVLPYRLRTWPHHASLEPAGRRKHGSRRRIIRHRDLQGNPHPAWKTGNSNRPNLPGHQSKTKVQSSSRRTMTQ